MYTGEYFMGEPLQIREATRKQGNVKLSFSDFIRFRSFLALRAGLDPDRTVTLVRTIPAKLYAAGSIVGIDEVAMANAIAEFLSLPYSEHLNDRDPQFDILPSSFCITHGVIPLRDS